ARRSALPPRRWYSWTTSRVISKAPAAQASTRCSSTSRSLGRASPRRRRGWAWTRESLDGLRRMHASTAQDEKPHLPTREAMRLHGCRLRQFAFPNLPKYLSEEFLNHMNHL